MAKYAKLDTLACLVFLAACAHNGVMPAAPASSESFNSSTVQSIVTHGDFSEYSLPASINPSALTRGPYDTVYFTGPDLAGGQANVYKMMADTGKVHTFTAPSAYQSAGFSSIISLNRSVYWVVKQPINEDTFYLARVTSEGVMSFAQTNYLEYGVLTNFALEPWNTSAFTYGWCVDPCQSPQAGIVAGASLTDYFVPQGITGGPGNSIYATAIQQTPDGTPTDSRVYAVNSSAALVHTFDLPNGSEPGGIATGSDHNLWLTEPGTNKIGRLTPAGTLTEFTLPTANAGPDRITRGYDNALYFTETNANRIGRITTAGKITEYTIPTANSQPTGIEPCSSVNCGKYGGVWFTETAANKIGRFNAPI